MIADIHNYQPIRFGHRTLRVRWVGLTTLRLQDEIGGNYAFSKQLYWKLYYNV